eukprot:TRINITY_DN42775_c0_g1_i1.p1 TRINITY_DN42775_c0_g1~~TRINITY_DN42775_c0_g1_i1.p1  ORF type:complete len:237 (-),score=31.67 TRINITY_DN42775_c0_g1_i1:211-921(-)
MDVAQSDEASLLQERPAADVPWTSLESDNETTSSGPRLSPRLVKSVRFTIACILGVAAVVFTELWHYGQEVALSHHLSALCFGVSAALAVWILLGTWQSPVVCPRESGSLPLVAVEPEPRGPVARMQNSVLADRIQQLNERTRVCTREQWEEAYLPDILGPEGSEQRLQFSSECSVCLGSIAMHSKVRGLGCGHMFHLQCLADWFLRDQSYELRCPLCRAPIYEQPRIELEAVGSH